MDYYAGWDMRWKNNKQYPIKIVCSMSGATLTVKLYKLVPKPVVTPKPTPKPTATPKPIVTPAPSVTPKPTIEPTNTPNPT